jgi:hypothetical protein
MKTKLLLFCTYIFSGVILNAQQKPSGRTCGTPVPSQQWTEWFNNEVERYIRDNKITGEKRANYTIPVVVHVIHSGGAVGVGDNISQAQVVDQINIINADFAGTGTNVANVPPAFAALVANCNVNFCLAVSNPTGGAIAQPGIDRVLATTIPGIASVPAGGFSQATIDGSIKPATIWNPIKYCNMWVLKLQTPLLGYATFPAGTALPGIAGGGSATTDGVVIGHNYFGSVGSASASAPYNLGRTASHELGHWLGLRHVWGDGNCLTDYCNDTPVAKQANFGCPVAPAYVNRCGAGLSPNGEMTMNFMDYTDDPCMYMFTPDQRTRVQTAMSQGTYRNLLGTHGLCNVAPPPSGPAVAMFDLNGQQPCVGTPFTPNNSSTGGPAPSYTWTSFPTASFNPNANVAAPAITFTGSGTYTLTLTASNSLATSSASYVVQNVAACPKPPVCLDTIRMIKNIDTLKTYASATNSDVLGCQTGYTGFLTGTNCFKDKEFGQYYPGTTYSDTPMPQVNSIIVLFDKRGTKATPTTSATQIYCKVYGGTATQGPGSMLAQISDSLGKIGTQTATNQVSYCGNPGYIFPSNVIIPHKFNFATPVIIPSNGFFGAVETPFVSPQDSIEIFSNTKTNLTNDSSAWVLIYANNWRTMRYQRSAKIQLAIMPQITCRPVVGIEEKSEFKSNVTIMPNPGTGVFNLVFTLPKQSKINIKIYNCMGQEISSDNFENVSENVFNLDLSSKADGVYFIEIFNGSEKITKKILISK